MTRSALRCNGRSAPTRALSARVATLRTIEGIAPAIDWNRVGALGAMSEPTPRNPRQSNWVADFVGDLGRSQVERNPNAAIRLIVPPTQKGT